MDVVVPEKSQSKKVFKARKTMKRSDRQQLESIQNAHSSSSSSSSPPSPAVVNGKSPDGEDQTEKVRESPREARPASSVSRSPSPITLSLSLSPSPPSQTPELTSCSRAPSSPALSPRSVGKGNEGDHGPSSTEGGETVDHEKTDGGEAKEVDCAVLRVKDRKPDGDVLSPLDSPQDSVAASGSPMASETKAGDGEMETDKRTKSEEAVPMDTDHASTETKPIPAADKTSCPPLSLSHAPESDQEVKEGFLVLSEEDEAQGERGEGKGIESVKGNRDGEQTAMKVCAERKEVEEDVGITAGSPSPAPPSSGDTGGVDRCSSVPSVRKRARCKDAETDGRKDRAEEGVTVRLGKKPKVEGELEAQLKLKIRADGGTRLKLEKVVQQLVEERLRVLQLSVFDRSLQELRDRVEKMECAKKHQQTLSALQAKVARLAKKFGAACQAKEKVGPQEVRSLQSAANTTPTPNTSPISTFRPVGTTVANQSNQTPPPRPLSATASPAQPKALSNPTPPPPSPTGSAPVPSHVSTPAAPGSSRTPPLQPPLTQLPLAPPNAKGGSISALAPATVAALSRANPTKSSPSPAAPPLPEIAPARGAHPGGSSAGGAPGSGVSASTARPPSQCVPVVGIASSSTPVAAGAGQSAVPGPSTATASKTDNQTTNFAASKPPAQAPRTSRSGAVIDLTDDDDDVQVTGVKKARVLSGSNAASPPSSSSFSLSSPAPSAAQLSSAPPPSSLVNSSTPHGLAAGSTARSSPQSGQPVANGPPPPPRSPQNSPSKICPSSTAVAGSSPARPPTPPPQRPELKLARVQSDSGIVLSWGLGEKADPSCAALDSYHLYAYHQDRTGPPPLPPSPSSSSPWKKIGEVKALPLPMACTLSQFVAGTTYYFAVRARDVSGRFGLFCEPQCTEVIGSLSSG